MVTVCVPLESGAIGGLKKKMIGMFTPLEGLSQSITAVGIGFALLFVMVKVY